MSTTIEIPLELDLTDPTNANAYWTRQDIRSGYQGAYRFTNGVFPNSLMIFKGNVPANIASPTNWDLVLEHAGQSTAGAALVRVEAYVLGSGDTPGAPTVIVPNKLVGVGASGDHNITRLAGVSGLSNFDGLVVLGASKELVVHVMRAPNGASGDTAGASWDLRLPPLLRVDVN